MITLLLGVVPSLVQFDGRPLKMIDRQKDTGFGWKLEDFKFRAALTIVQHLHFFLKSEKSKKTNNIYYANYAYVIFKT
jgi:hypothetical protein